MFVRLATVVDIVLLALGVAVAYISWQYGFGSFARPGPGLYPFFVGTAIAAFALCILRADRHGTDAAMHFEQRAVATLALMTLTFVLWIVAMPWLGYVLVTFGATLAFSKIMRLEGWRKPLVLSAATAAVIYLLFDYWLYIDLPRGILG